MKISRGLINPIIIGCNNVATTNSNHCHFSCYYLHVYRLLWCWMIRWFSASLSLWTSCQPPHARPRSETSETSELERTKHVIHPCVINCSAYLCSGFVLFSSCPYGFSPFTLASSHNSDTCTWVIRCEWLVLLLLATVMSWRYAKIPGTGFKPPPPSPATLLRDKAEEDGQIYDRWFKNKGFCLNVCVCIPFCFIRS